MKNSTYELLPEESQNQKSFYKKAIVEVDEEGNQTLYSYGTKIIRKSASGDLIKYWNGWSATTGKHIFAFCGLHKKEYEKLSDGENDNDCGYFYKCSLVKEKESGYDLQLTSSECVYELAKSMGMEDECDEYCYMVALNTNAKIIGIHEISHGSLSASLVVPREVFKRAILNNAASIILIHNHPSGNCTPSITDIRTTEKMIKCGSILGIHLHDHVVIGHGSFTSIAQSNGDLWDEKW